MNLPDMVRDLDSLDRESAIYAVKPWAEGSEAILVSDSETGERIIYDRPNGMSYFIDITVARDFLEDFAVGNQKRILRRQVQPADYYAIYDD
jgi:hypothetical protein